MSDWSLETSIAVFCGDAWLRESNVLAYRAGEPVGVASLHGPPLAREGELYLVFLGPVRDGARDAETVTRALAAHSFDFARSSALPLRIEVDDADAALWTVLTEIPATHGPDVLLLANDP